MKELGDDASQIVLLLVLDRACQTPGELNPCRAKTCEENQAREVLSSKHAQNQSRGRRRVRLSAPAAGPSPRILLPDSSLPVPPLFPSSSGSIVSPWLCSRNRSCRTSAGYDSLSDPETTSRTPLRHTDALYPAIRWIRATRLQTRQRAPIAALHLTRSRSGSRPVVHALRRSVM